MLSPARTCFFWRRTGSSLGSAPMREMNFSALCWNSSIDSASSFPQTLRLISQPLEIIRLGDLVHLPRFTGFVDLDPQFLELLLQALFAHPHFEAHALEDAGE